MCTITWWLAPDGAGYEVFFNRDERRTRQPAAPPSLARRLEVDYLAPTDADFRGTWLLVNNHGLTLAFINHYPANPKPSQKPARSRGMLARDLADAASIAEVRARLAQVKLGHYGAFFIFVFERGQKPVKWTWDTRNLLENPAAEPLPFFTSSSFRSEDIRRHRRKFFAENWAQKNRLDSAGLAEFHLQTEPARPAFGVLMDRADARTVSFSHITVGPGQEVVFSYQARSPANGSLFESPLTWHLPLTAQPPTQSAS